MDRQCPDRLTERDRIVLKAIARGQTLRDAAGQASVGTQKVKNRMASIYKELHAVSAANAIVLALKDGLFTLDEL